MRRLPRWISATIGAGELGERGDLVRSLDETPWNPGIVMTVFPDSTVFHPGYL
jgi:hypothetical protein